MHSVHCSSEIWEAAVSTRSARSWVQERQEPSYSDSVSCWARRSSGVLRIRIRTRTRVGRRSQRVMDLRSLLPHVLLLFGVGFLIANLRIVWDLVRYMRRRPHAV